MDNIPLGRKMLQGLRLAFVQSARSRVHECRSAALPTPRAVRNKQALEAKHARLAPLRQKYGVMTGTLATKAARQGGTPSMAASMLTLHLVRDTGTPEAVRHSLPVPGDTSGGVPMLVQTRVRAM